MKTILYGRSGKWVRRVALILLDMAFVFIAVYVSLLLRFDGHITRLQYGYTMQWMPASGSAWSSTSRREDWISVYSMRRPPAMTTRLMESPP